MFDFKGRFNRVIKSISKDKISHLLINDPADLYYLSGYYEKEVFGVLDFTQRNIYIFTDSRFTKIAKDKIRNGEVIEYKDDVFKAMAKVLSKEIYLSEYSTSVKIFKKLKKYFSVKTLDISPITKIRQIKDSDEIYCISRASLICDSVLEFIQKEIIHEGITEEVLAWEIEKAIRDRGANSISFSPIVAFGESSSCPHHFPTSKKLEKNTPILLDVGAKFNHYASDITRMFWFGDNIDKDFEKTYMHVLAAEEDACKNFKVGVKGKEVDKKCREFLKKYDLDTYFTHGLGHSIGINVHDGKSLSKKSDVVIERGLVSSIEPGVYIESKYGIRIEDTVVINPENNEFEILTKASKKLIKIS